MKPNQVYRVLEEAALRDARPGGEVMGVIVHPAFASAGKRFRISHRASGMLVATAIVLAVAWPAGRLGAASAPAAHSRFRLVTSAFGDGQFVPSKYTCSGIDVSPELRWLDPPAGTASFVLIMYDPDAPGGTFIHWLAYNLPATTRNLAQGVPQGNRIEGGGLQGTSGFGKVGYGGPCPPPGDAHHYHIALYAVDSFLKLDAGATREQVERAMKGHILGKAELVGLYRR